LADLGKVSNKKAALKKKLESVCLGGCTNLSGGLEMGRQLFTKDVLDSMANAG